jgi:lipoprotein-anchoring transpeptidase ErfK/SrfK
MLKQSVRLVSLLWAFGLPFSSQLPVASKPTVLPNNTYNWVAKPTNSSYNSVTQTTHLEISLSRRQVALYQGKSRIKSYRIAVGRPGWETPTGNFLIGQMLRNPTWIHPFTGEAIAGGDPENPLGHYWIGFWTDGKNSIGFHGTPNFESVGKAASHGCIRMYNKDVEELFHQVRRGTLVKVVQ